MTSKTTNKYAPEVRERAVRMALDHERNHASRWEAVPACINANDICSSVYLDFFISSSFLVVLTRPENSHSNRMKKQAVEPAQKPLGNRLRHDTPTCLLAH